MSSARTNVASAGSTAGAKAYEQYKRQYDTFMARRRQILKNQASARRMLAGDRHNGPRQVDDAQSTGYDGECNSRRVSRAAAQSMRRSCSPWTQTILQVHDENEKTP